jgi:hypothetical protein
MSTLRNRPDGGMWPPLDRHRRICEHLDEMSRAMTRMKDSLIEMCGDGEAIKAALKKADEDLGYCEAYS